MCGKIVGPKDHLPPFGKIIFSKEVFFVSHFIEDKREYDICEECEKKIKDFIGVDNGS